MKKWNKIMAGFAAVLAVSAISMTAYAAEYSTPAEAAAYVTGRTTQEIVTEREAGKSYAMIAQEADKLEEYKEAVKTIQKEALDARVADGILTQEQADQIQAAQEERLALCDGTTNCILGAGCIYAGQGTGYSGGYGAGYGCGYGGGYGRGYGRGAGCGMGMGYGACFNY